MYHFDCHCPVKGLLKVLPCLLINGQVVLSNKKCCIIERHVFVTTVRCMPNVTLCALSTDTVDNDLECPVQACAFNIYSVIACMALMKLSSIENICKVF